MTTPTTQPKAVNPASQQGSPFHDQAQQIIAYGKANGKSDADTFSAIKNLSAYTNTTGDERAIYDYGLNKGMSHNDIQGALSKFQKSNTKFGKLENNIQTGDTGYIKGMPSRVAEQQVQGADKIAGSIKEGASNISKGENQFGESGLKNKLMGAGKIEEGGVQAAAGTIAGGAQSVFAPITAAVSPIIQKEAPVLVPAAIQAIQTNFPVLSSVYNSLPASVRSTIATKLQQIKSTITTGTDKHPDLTSTAGDIANTILLAVGGTEAEQPVKQALSDALTKDGLQVVKDSIPSLGDIGDAAKDIKGKIAAKFAPKSEGSTIEDLISPKANSKEAKLATQQGRLVKGEEPGIFSSGTADRVLPSTQTARAAVTIENQIPGAAKMTEPQLYTSLDNKVTEIAQNLQPEMEATPVTKQTVQQANSEWSELKAKQLEDADATDEPNVKKSQKQFQERLKKLGNSKNLNDWWEARKDYDASVPDNVKNANSLSSESLQNKRSIWLQNRAILNNGINAEESGLGETSRQSFSDMNDMYNAKEGILSKAKIETIPKQSKLFQGIDFIKKHPLGSAISLGSVYEAAKHL